MLIPAPVHSAEDSNLPFFFLLEFSSLVLSFSSPSDSHQALASSVPHFGSSTSLISTLNAPPSSSEPPDSSSPLPNPIHTPFLSTGMLLMYVIRFASFSISSTASLPLAAFNRVSS